MRKYIKQSQFFAALLQVFCFAMPWPLRRRVLCYIFGYEIAPTALVGLSIIFADRCILEQNCHVGHLNLIKGLNLLHIEEFAILGSLNWVTGFPLKLKTHFMTDGNRDPCLHIKRHAAVTNRHLIDCTDRVTIDEYTTVAGWRSQILTHAIDMTQSAQRCAPIYIGKYCFVGTGVIILKGATLPSYSVLSAGSVLSRKQTDEGVLYSGVPAIPSKKLDLEAEYFKRENGFVF